MQHPTCKEGRKLLDSYVVALSICQNLRRLQGVAPGNAPSSYFGQRLAIAGQEYWRHVNEHDCRRPVTLAYQDQHQKAMVEQADTREFSQV